MVLLHIMILIIPSLDIKIGDLKPGSACQANTKNYICFPRKCDLNKRQKVNIKVNKRKQAF